MDNVGLFDTTATMQVYKPRRHHARCISIWHCHAVCWLYVLENYIAVDSKCPPILWTKPLDLLFPYTNNVTSHVFAQTTHVWHVVPVPHRFACKLHKLVVIPATYLYIPSFIEIRWGALEPHSGRNLAISITLASGFYYTSCTTAPYI